MFDFLRRRRLLRRGLASKKTRRRRTRNELLRSLEAAGYVKVIVLAAFIAQLDIWYLIPVEKLGHRRLIFLYPQGRKMPFGGLYEEYREAWHLLKEEEFADRQVHEFVDR